MQHPLGERVEDGRQEQMQQGCCHPVRDPDQKAMIPEIPKHLLNYIKEEKRKKNSQKRITLHVYKIQ